MVYQRCVLIGGLIAEIFYNGDLFLQIMHLLFYTMPIAIIAFIGLLRKKFIGFVAAMMEFSICVYFPLFYIFQLWNTHIETALGAAILWGIPSLLGIVGLWMNREIFKK